MAATSATRCGPTRSFRVRNETKDGLIDCEEFMECRGEDRNDLETTLGPLEGGMGQSQGEGEKIPLPGRHPTGRGAPYAITGSKTTFGGMGSVCGK